MKIDANIEKELLGIAPILLKLDRVNLYEVPEGYFEQNAMNINSLSQEPSVSSEAMPAIFAGIEKKELYAAPAPSYFQSFSDSLLSRVHADDVAEELSYALPILQHVAKQDQYVVPSSYFASFPETITKMASREVVKHTSAIEVWLSKLDSLSEKVFSRITRPNWSFATASIIGIIMCVGLVVNNNTLSDEDKIFAQMQQIPDADLHHYIAKHRDEFDEHTILHDINNVEFTHYFDKPEQVTPHIESHVKADQNKDDEALNEDILD